MALPRYMASNRPAWPRTRDAGFYLSVKYFKIAGQREARRRQPTRIWRPDEESRSSERNVFKLGDLYVDHERCFAALSSADQ